MMRINLLPKEERGRGKGPSQGLGRAWAAFALVALLTGMLTIFNRLHLDVARQQAAALAAQGMPVAAKQKALAQLRSQNNELAATVERLADYLHTDDNTEFLHLLQHSVRAVPPGIQINELAAAPDRVEMAGFAAGTDDLSRLVGNVQDVPGVTHVQLETMEPAGSGDQWPMTFSVIMSVEEPRR